MKGMKTLIKMQQKDLDELRREQTGLQDQRDALINLLTRMENELQEERRLAEGRLEFGPYLEEYAARVKQRRIGIVQEIVQIGERLEQLAEAIAVSFGELKKYEITKENYDIGVKAKNDRKEQTMLDEVGLQQHIRKEE